MNMKKNKTAFVTGITGQDGGYLLSFYWIKDMVHALRRRTSSDELKRIEKYTVMRNCIFITVI